MSVTTFRIAPSDGGTWALARERQSGRAELVQEFASKEAAIAWGMAHIEEQAPCKLEVIRSDGAIAFRRLY